MSQQNQVTKQDNPLHRVLRTFWGDDFDFFTNGHQTLRDLQRETNLSLSEDEKCVYIEAALPGLLEEEIEVTLERGILWIQGHKKEKETNRKYHYRAKRSYSYQIALPDTVDEKKEPEAKYDKGVLDITFYKTQGTSAKKIHVKGS